MFLINFNQWKYACVGINNWVIYSSVTLDKQLMDMDVSTQGSDILSMFKVQELKSKLLFRKNGRS